MIIHTRSVTNTKQKGEENMNIYCLFDIVEYLPQRYYSQFVQINKKCKKVVEQHPNKELLYSKSITSSSIFNTIEEKNTILISPDDFDSRINEFESCEKLIINETFTKTNEHQNNKIIENIENIHFEQWIHPSIFSSLQEITLPLHLISIQLSEYLNDIAFCGLKIICIQTKETIEPNDCIGINHIVHNPVLLYATDFNGIQYISKSNQNIHIYLYPPIYQLTIPFKKQYLQYKTNKTNQQPIQLKEWLNNQMNLLMTKRIVFSPTVFHYHLYREETSTKQFIKLYQMYLPRIQTDDPISFECYELVTKNPFIQSNDLLKLTIDISQTDFIHQTKFNFSHLTSVTELCLIAEQANRTIKIPSKIKKLTLQKMVSHMNNIIVVNNDEYVGNGIECLTELKQLELHGIFDESLSFPSSLQSLQIQSVDIQSINTFNLHQLTQLSIQGTKINELHLPITLCDLILVKCRHLKTIHIYGKMKLVDKIQECNKLVFKKNY